MLDNIDLTVKNLGAVKTGNIKPKPLTLLCGQNNTGKTWVMYALYSLCSLDNDFFSEIFKLNKEDDNQFSELNIDSFVKKYSNNVTHFFNDFFNARLAGLFNIDASLFKGDELTLNVDWKNLSNEMSRLKVNHSVKTNNDKEFNVFSKKDDPCFQMKQKNGMPFEEVYKYSFLMSMMLIPVNKKVFLLPAERNGLHLFFRELSNKRTALLHQASHLDVKLDELLSEVRKTPYAKPVADYIDWLNNIVEIQKNKSEPIFHVLAEELKKGLVGGDYQVDSQSGAISFTPYLSTDNVTPTLGLHTASSSVKSLFSLWLYLEHQAKVGDVLMIDEPESNIHPVNQRKLARFLVRLVNAGLQVIISTHSDYIVNEINSLILLKDDGDKKLVSERARLLKEHGYQQDETLSTDKIGAYHFSQGTIQPFKMTKEEGIYATTFDEVISDMNKVNNDIYYSLQEAAGDDDED